MCFGTAKGPGNDEHSQRLTVTDGRVKIRGADAQTDGDAPHEGAAGTEDGTQGAEMQHQLGMAPP